MSDLPFQFFDCDNHYYEATDAFTRHLAPGFAKRTMQWAQIGGKTRLLVGGKINRIPNPTFDPVAKPGAMDEYFRGRNPRKASTIELFGELEPIRAEYRDRDARLARMDQQGMAGATAWLWPPGSPDIRALIPSESDSGHGAPRPFHNYQGVTRLIYPVLCHGTCEMVAGTGLRTRPGRDLR
jgi:hypothetical protein